MMKQWDVCYFSVLSELTELQLQDVTQKYDVNKHDVM